MVARALALGDGWELQGRMNVVDGGSTYGTNETRRTLEQQARPGSVLATRSMSVGALVDRLQYRVSLQVCVGLCLRSMSPSLALVIILS